MTTTTHVPRPGETEAIQSVRDPGPDSLAETIDNLGANVTQAARREQRALDALAALRPGDVKERAMDGWRTQAKHEQAHWRACLGVYRRWLELHPELADWPIGTRCSHGPTCSLDSPAARETGADDAPPPPPANHWTEEDPDAAA